MSDKLYVSDQMLKDHLVSLIRQMAQDNYTPSVIIGPSRGALQMGVMLSHFYDVPFEPFNWQTRDGDSKDEDKLLDILKKHTPREILLVDDINDTGETLLSIFSTIDQAGFFKDIRVATLFNKSTSDFTDVDYSAVELTPDTDKWIVFPYEEWWNSNKFKENK